MPDRSLNSKWQDAIESRDPKKIQEVLDELTWRIAGEVGIHDARGLGSLPIIHISPKKTSLAENDNDAPFYTEYIITSTCVNEEVINRAIERVLRAIAEILNGTRPMPSRPGGYIYRTAKNAIREYFRTDRSEEKGVSLLQKEDEDDESEGGGNEITRGFRSYPPPEKRKKQKGVRCATCNLLVDANGDCRNPKCGNCPRHNPYNPKDNTLPKEIVGNNGNGRHEPGLFDTTSPIGKLWQSLRDMLLDDGSPRGAPHQALQEFWREANSKVELAGMPMVDGQVMRLFLFGYRPKDIASKLGMWKENVSRGLNTWFNRWGWEDDYQYKVRLCSLYHNFVDVGIGNIRNKKYKNRIYQNRVYEADVTEAAYNALVIDERVKPWLKFFGFNEGNAGDLLGFIYFLWKHDWGLGTNYARPRHATSYFDDEDDDWESSLDHEQPDWLGPYSLHELC